jgi:hypothetical protein
MLAGKVKRKDRAQLNSLAVATRVGGGATATISPSR